MGGEYFNARRFRRRARKASEGLPKENREAPRQLLYFSFGRAEDDWLKAYFVPLGTIYLGVSAHVLLLSLSAHVQLKRKKLPRFRGVFALLSCVILMRFCIELTSWERHSDTLSHSPTKRVSKLRSFDVIAASNWCKKSPCHIHRIQFANLK